MTYSAFLVAFRNSVKRQGQGASRAAQQVQRPVQNQNQRAASTQTTKPLAEHQPKTLEEQFDYLALDDYGDPCMVPMGYWIK